MKIIELKFDIGDFIYFIHEKRIKVVSVSGYEIKQGSKYVHTEKGWEYINISKTLYYSTAIQGLCIDEKHAYKSREELIKSL